MVRRLLVLALLLGSAASVTAACGGPGLLHRRPVAHVVGGIHERRVESGRAVFPLRRGAGCSGAVGGSGITAGGCTGTPSLFAPQPVFVAPPRK